MKARPAATGIWRRRTVRDPIACACGCHGRLNRYDRSGRERRFLRGHHLRAWGISN